MQVLEHEPELKDEYADFKLYRKDEWCLYLVAVGKDGPHCLKKGDGTEFL